MSTSINPEAAGSGISERKSRHLEICSGNAEIDSAGKNLFSEIDFLHNAFPEIDSDSVDTGTTFLDTEISVPLFISCMTGGTLQGMAVNTELARAAEEYRIPVGMGSFRILIEHPELFDHFNLKKYAPSVPVIGNIGTVQLRDENKKQILKIAADLGADAVAVHVNPAQELFQPEGDTDFRNLKMHAAEFIAMADCPVIIKETGCGFTSGLIEYFIKAGAAYIDLAGAGGTNWISVERERLDGPEYDAAREFADWGIPTAVSLFNSSRKKIIASGGINSGMDAVKAVAMGAECAGMARQFINAYTSGGRAAVSDLIKSITIVFKSAMTLNGALNIDQLRKSRLIFGKSFLDTAEQYKKAEQ